MLSELLDELIEDSPFLRQLHQEALAEGEARGEARGRVAELQVLIRELVRARFPGIAPEELAGVDTLADADQLHAMALALASAPDEGTARRALAEVLK